jgi:hypothetical protein
MDRFRIEAVGERRMVAPDKGIEAPPSLRRK